MSIVDSALDFIEFIIMLAGVCAICFNLIIPITKDIRNLGYEHTYDKTVGLARGEKDYNPTLTGLSAEEISLQIASQNSYVPKATTSPNIEDMEAKIKADKELETFNATNKAEVKIGTSPKITIGNAQYDVATASEAYQFIKDWCSSKVKNIDDMEFKVIFDSGTSEDAKDNCYVLYYLDGNEFKPCDYRAGGTCTKEGPGGKGG